MTPAEHRQVLIPDDLMARLKANAESGDAADPVPVLKLFNPAGPGTWLITEIQSDGDTMFGLCDVEMDCVELGYVSLAELTGLRLPLGLSIERDEAFQGRVPLSVWTETSRRTRSIREAETLVAKLPPSHGQPRA